MVITVAQDRLTSSKMPCCLNYHLDLCQACSKTLDELLLLGSPEKEVYEAQLSAQSSYLAVLTL